MTSCQNSCLDETVHQFVETEFLTISTQLDKNMIVGGQALLSVFFFERLTGIPSSVKYGDTSVYRSKSDFKSDRKAWIHWLNEEGCTLTLSQLREVRETVEGENPYLR